jgi:hypothetical protein
MVRILLSTSLGEGGATRKTIGDFLKCSIYFERFVFAHSPFWAMAERAEKMSGQRFLQIHTGGNGSYQYLLGFEL